MDRLKIIFIGTGKFGVNILETLIKDTQIQIPLLITGQDKPAGRKLALRQSDIKECAISNKLIVQQPTSVNKLEQKIMQIKPDFLLVVAYGKILPESILRIPKYGAINIHGSLLPKYRGASSIQESLLNGDNVTGITWILMNEKMDKGPIIAQKTLKIEDNDTYETLSEKLSGLAAENTPKVLESFVLNNDSSIQDENKATYCRKINKEDGFIDLHKETADGILRKIKAYTPWPGCYIFWNNKRLKIVQAKISEQKICTDPGSACICGNALFLGTKKGVLMPTIVQPESKKQMPIKDFILGQKNTPKDKLFRL